MSILLFAIYFFSQDTIEFYLLFFIIYALLVPVQVYAVSHQKHPVTKLFTSSLFLEFFGVMLNLLNSLKFAVDGEGLPYLAVIGDVLDILSRVCFAFLFFFFNIMLPWVFKFSKENFMKVIKSFHCILVSCHSSK